jgi:hypothetical protein
MGAEASMAPDPLDELIADLERIVPPESPAFGDGWGWGETDRLQLERQRLLDEMDDQTLRSAVDPTDGERGTARRPTGSSLGPEDESPLES